MKRLGFLACVTGLLAGCGGHGTAKDAADAGLDVASALGEAGPAEDAPFEALPPGWRVYDVTATATVTPVRGQDHPGDFSTFPTTFTFVLAWNHATGDTYVRGGSAVAKGGLSTTDNRTFTGGQWVGTAAFAEGCGGQGRLVLDAVTLTVDGAAIAGTAIARAFYVTSGAAMLEAPVTAKLVGVTDGQAPTFTSPGPGVDPLAGVVLEASEPLPPQASASLIGASSHDVVPLSGLQIDNPAGGLHGFGTSGAVLRPGETYTLVTDHIVDFLGRAPTAPITFSTRAAPPLVPEDGFESVTGTMFGGAGVLRGGPLTPLAGQTSLLLNTGFGGGFGFLPYDLGPSLAVRLAVSPGDSVVRFDSQLIAPDPIDAASFVGDLRFGTAGATVATARDVAGAGFVKVTLPQLGDVYVSPVKTVELPLPADAAGEILFEIVGQTFTCDPPPSPTVLVLDNLRVE